MPATLLVKKGQARRLPSGQKFTGGLGWDEAQGQEEADLDLWLSRTWRDGHTEVLYWGNTGFYRPDLGVIHNPGGEDNPFLAFPELDVIHSGDDRTGFSSQGGYDENVTVDFTKTPADVVQYGMWVTIYDDPDDFKGLTIGVATNIVCGIKEEASGNELQAKLEEEHAFDTTVLICTIERDEESEHWVLRNKNEGYGDTMFDVATKLGIHFG